jgi:hypothetical protein
LDSGSPWSLLPAPLDPNSFDHLKGYFRGRAGSQAHVSAFALRSSSEGLWLSAEPGTDLLAD